MWSRSETKDYLTSYCEGLSAHTMDISKSIVGFRESKYVFYAMNKSVIKGNSQHNHPNGAIGKYVNVHRLVVDPTTMKCCCSCGRKAQNGRPCVCMCILTSFPFWETLSAAKTVAVLANSCFATPRADLVCTCVSLYRFLGRKCLVHDGINHGILICSKIKKSMEF